MYFYSSPNISAVKVIEFVLGYLKREVTVFAFIVKSRSLYFERKPLNSLCFFCALHSINSS